ncbi:MAG: diguanylate cyclase [Acidimicrobiales bacterium]|jgi:diguanylate cyclase (GGDEF)-like protein/PAS domain S-box-containing protein|nr:diguanylate cyclase [Acidimicrobiales bacterium]
MGEQSARPPDRFAFGTAQRAAALDWLPDPTLALDADGVVLYANRAFVETFGWSPEAIDGAHVFHYVHPDDLEYVLLAFDNRRRADGEVGLIVRARGRAADGRYVAVELCGRSGFEIGGLGAHLVTFRDLSRRAPLLNFPDRLRSLVDLSSDLLLLVDGEGVVQFANQTLTRALGHDCDLLVGRRWIELVHPDDATATEASLAELRPGSRRATQWRARLRRADEGTRLFELHAVDQRADPIIRGIIVSGRDVTDLAAMEAELRRRNEELAHRAEHDELTGLLNRAAFNGAVSTALSPLADRRTAGDRRSDDVVVLYCDLDDFKPVNDRFGHDAGDHVLRTIADRLRATVRDDDLVARYGGDEFAILCSGAGAPDETGVAHLVDRLRGAVRLPIDIGGEPVAVEVSIGVTRGRRGDQVDLVVAAADKAMYEHKRSGRR